jgi:dethiobiotin synthetase
VSADARDGAPRGRVVFVTGTDTGVGKTWVSCGLVRAARRAGFRVAVRKPAETGCDPGPDGKLVARDAAELHAAAESDEALDAICRVVLPDGLAPAYAARRAGITIDVPALVEDCRRRAAEVDLLLVEGAGGLLVPIADRYRYADLARDIDARVLLVVGARLGAINHALLTLEVAAAHGLDVAGFVVNHFSTARDLATDTLADSLRDQSDVPLVAELAYGADASAVWTPDLLETLLR